MASQQPPFRLSNTSECCHIWISISTPHLTILEVWTRGLTWWFSPWVLSDSWNPLDYSPSGSSVRGIFPARILEWVAISFSRGSAWPGIKPGSPALQVYSLRLSQPGSQQFSKTSNRMHRVNSKRSRVVLYSVPNSHHCFSLHRSTQE